MGFVQKGAMARPEARPGVRETPLPLPLPLPLLLLLLLLLLQQK